MATSQYRRDLSFWSGPFRAIHTNIRKIDAFLQRSPYGMNSGWSTWAQGMSDFPRDVTFEAPAGL